MRVEWLTPEVLSYILMFFTTAFLGWCMEVVCKLIQFHRFINRGFLIGPYCPIYGFGAVLVTACLQRYAEDPFAVFGLAMLLCGTLEYVTSYVMEKLFNARWWDYSGKRFNLNGRVCANTLIPFGLLGLVMVYVLRPFIFDLYAQMSLTVLTTVDAVLCCGISVDAVLSVTVLSRIRAKADAVEGDSTEAITRAVHQALMSEGILVRRALKAFPYARLTNRRLVEKLKADRAEMRRRADESRELLRKELATIEDKVKADAAEARTKAEAHAEHLRNQIKHDEAARKQP